MRESHKTALIYVPYDFTVILTYAIFIFRAVQEVRGGSAETCLVPFFHVGAPTLPPF